MSRFAGLPCRMSSKQDRPSATPSFVLLPSTVRKAVRAATGGALGLALPVILGTSSVLPAVPAAAAPAPAAAFAVTGVLGASGDAGAAAVASFDVTLRSGTLVFGDPNDPPPDAPAFGDSSDKNDPSADPNNEPANPQPTPEPTPPAAATPPPAEATPPPAETTPPAETPSDDPDTRIAARGLKVAQIARRFVGYPYRYGAAGPRAFDCSGLTLYVYRQVGVRLPHKARAQFSTRFGRRISGTANLIAGDLLFFRNTAGPGITHAAVYVGNGMMVTANTPRTGVQLASLSSAYWRRHYAGAIRPGL